MSDYENFEDFDYENPDYQRIKMSSFLAAIFLSYERISCIDFINYRNDIQDEKKIYIVEEKDDNLDDISKLFRISDTEIFLTVKYSNLISVKGKEMTVYDYLSSLVTIKIREYLEEEVKKRTKGIA